jgi:hypothetical protein
MRMAVAVRMIVPVVVVVVMVMVLRRGKFMSMLVIVIVIMRMVSPKRFVSFHCAHLTLLAQGSAYHPMGQKLGSYKAKTQG